MALQPRSPSGKFETLAQRTLRQQQAVANVRPNAKNNVFGDILQKAANKNISLNAEQSRRWFRDQAQKTNISANKILSNKGYSIGSSNSAGTGSMYLFQYDPKTKAKLPYYDQFPLVFPIGPAAGGFLGINLHYLPLPMRARLMDALYTLTNNKKYDETTKLRISYEILSSAAKFAYFKPCIKHYLYTHVKSRFIMIHPMEWDIALFLPLQKFQKAGQSKVWNDSRKAV